MKIWYDALTGKHLRYGVAIARQLRKVGHEVTVTNRKHPDTLPMAEYLNEKVIVVGKYDPRSLLTRLREGTKRQLAFSRIFGNDPPDAAISHGSADQCRVAFGLGKPIISTVDTPYAEAVHKLTLPLSKYIVASKAIPKEVLQQYNVDGEIVNFNSVDEVAWIKNFRPMIQFDFGRPLIVVRQLEEKATYAQNRIDLFLLAKKLTKLGKVVFLSRYDRKQSKNLIISNGFIDSASLVAQADLFVGVGGTITREAALQGTPSIVVKVFSEQYVNDFLAKKGFPIFETNPADVFGLAKKLIAKRFEVGNALNELENPVDVILKLSKKIDRN